ncbi:hypothetical protein [Halochromatium salexigens]|uniref:hypothetical protein n=1 Tax=Halochromatium salexigens TaxID=49447 RepID=UPI001F5D4350|nr:hypothetical protein [Halochromatium salexigens]
MRNRHDRRQQGAEADFGKAAGDQPHATPEAPPPGATAQRIDDSRELGRKHHHHDKG